MLILAGYGQYQKEPFLGDAICMLPLIEWCAMQSEEDVHLDIANDDVRQLIPKKCNIKTLRELPNYSFQNVKRISMTEMISAMGMIRHPTSQFFKMFGFAPQQEIIQPNIEFYDFNTPVFDVVISPFNNHNESTLDWFDWADLIYELNEMRKSVAIISKKCPEVPSDAFERLGSHDGEGLQRLYLKTSLFTRNRKVAHCTVVYDKGLPYICSLLRRCKHFISVETGTSRLAHALGLTNHTLLATNRCPAEWITHPGAKLIQQDEFSRKDIDTILQTI